MKRVYKYGTGHPIPEGAVHVFSCIEETGGIGRFVWHYFLVETD